MSVIKAGYRITVESYENNGDACKTVTVDGLSLDDAKFHARILSLINTTSQYGCMLSDDEELVDSFVYECRSIINSGKYVVNGLHTLDTISTSNVAIDDDSIDAISNNVLFDFIKDEILSQYVGYPEYDIYATRKVDNITVEFIPTEIDLGDITSQFTTELK